MILTSILAAFVIDPWWDDRQEQMRRNVLLEDLAAEIDPNTTNLESTLARQRSEAKAIEILLNELTPQRTGLPEDSVRALHATTFVGCGSCFGNADVSAVPELDADQLRAAAAGSPVAPHPGPTAIVSRRSLSHVRVA